MPVTPVDSRLETGTGAAPQPKGPLVVGISLGAMALLYTLSIPGNHAEAQDAFWYAYDVREKPWHALFHLHHLLYLPCMRLIYAAGHFPDAYHAMIGVDVACAVATVGVLFFWLERGLRLTRPACVFACLFLASAYGFWRYAVEAEVYLPALVLMSLLAWRVLRRGQPPPAAETWAGQTLTALLGAASMLMHAPLSTPLAVVAVPFYLLVTRRWRALAVYGAVATVLVTSAYYTAYRIESSAHDPAVQVPTTFAKFLATAGGGDPPEVAWSDMPKATTGLGATVVASNYLFAIPKTRAKLLAAFPTRSFAKEMFTADTYGLAHAYCGLALTLVLLAIIGFAACARLEWSRPSLRALLAHPENLALALWLAGYFGLVGTIEPENPENWICCLLPVAAAAGVLVHFLYRSLTVAWLPWAFIGLLLTHNIFNGVLIIHNSGSDFNVHKAAWVLAHARPGDVVFTRDNEVFTRYLRYHTPAQVINCFQLGGEATRRTVEQSPAAPNGTRYLFVDVLEPSAPLRASYPAMYDDLASLRRDLGPVLVPTGADDVKKLP